MSNFTNLPGIEDLWNKSLGNSEICIAVLDGLVDQTHPCFEGSNLTIIPTLVEGEASASGSMSKHGTHITSIIFGQHGSSVQGIAPQCRGLLLPVFSDKQRKLSQLDLSRAIEQAVNAGADIINISSGQLSDFGEAEDWLKRAVNLCKQRNVLIIAAAGNNGCDCLHVPASLPGVLAVGAMNYQGKPLEFSNWGKEYQHQGILAPGENILGAKPGGGTLRLSGTSFATPIVTGVAALLLSLQLQEGKAPDAQQVRNAILNSALPCNPGETDKRHCLVGKLNIPGALKLLLGEIMSESLETVKPSGCSCGATEVSDTRSNNNSEVQKLALAQAPNLESVKSTVLEEKVVSQTVDITGDNLIYALGTLTYDFRNEARRDSFKQLMPPMEIDGFKVPANPYDTRQMVNYLAENLSEAKSLIWTLNLESTPIYAIEPVGSFAREVYQALQELLTGQVEAENSWEYIERVSIPGRLSGRTIRLFSGQIVPIIELENTRGIYGWRVNNLVNAALKAAHPEVKEVDEQAIRNSLTNFLNRIYFDLRNLGLISQDRALNFAATNAFQAASAFITAVAARMELDSIDVQKSPVCRMDSDCWDVQLKFFDPENNQRAKKVFRFTIDVSDVIPVTLGDVRTWSTSN